MKTKTRKPKVGDKVTIFTDPITGQHREDDAILVELLADVSESWGLLHQRWLVRFDGETETFQRDIRGESLKFVD